MRKLLFFALLAAGAVLGYFYRGVFGREASIWLIAGFLAFVVVLKLMQVGLRRYVRTQEARTSPEERRDFEEYKRRASGEDKAT
jgi:hypothetical protein